MIPFDGTMERLASESLSQLSRTVVQEMETVHEGAAGSVAGGSVGASVAGCVAAVGASVAFVASVDASVGASVASVGAAVGVSVGAAVSGGSVTSSSVSVASCSPSVPPVGCVSPPPPYSTKTSVRTAVRTTHTSAMSCQRFQE